jgi:anti-sigma B factor antagonist
MFSTDLSTRSCGGHAVVALRGELDLADAAEVAAALTAVAAREPGIIVDLAGLEFIDASGVAALARGRRQARRAGGDLILAAPQRRVLRILAITRLAEAFAVYATVEEAVGKVGSFREGTMPPPRPHKRRWPWPGDLPHPPAKQRALQRETLKRAPCPGTSHPRATVGGAAFRGEHGCH